MDECVHPGLVSFVLYVFAVVCESAQRNGEWHVLYA